MRTFHLIPVLMAAAFVSFHASAADKVATFSSLPESDELRISFTSSGCFHYTSHELTFRRSAELTVSIARIEWSLDRKRVITTNRVALGNLTLSKAEVDGLDQLLQFYRSERQNNCTTVDNISISQHRGGKITATERFTDGSCSYDRKDLTRITHLIARLERRK